MSDSEKANQTARSIILPVDGMTCAACSRAVEQAIGRLDGVEQASVSAALVLVLVFSLFFRIIQVDGESMVPTLQNGDKLIVWGAGYEPQRGDVVIVDSYTAYGKPLVKRVIAKGGDVVNIDYQAGTVSVNGEVLQGYPLWRGYQGRCQRNVCPLGQLRCHR